MADDYFTILKRNMVKKLFNTQILQRNDVSPIVIAKEAGVSRSKVYRWINKFGFDPENNYSNDKSEDEIAELVWENLTGAEIERLYKWARGKKFNLRKNPEIRIYQHQDGKRAARRRSRNRTDKDIKADQAKNVKLIANAGMDPIQNVPVAKTAVEQQETIEKRLHDFVTTNSSTEKQVDELVKCILFGSKAHTEAVQAMLNDTRGNKDFNRQQWAFDQLRRMSGKTAYKSFKEALHRGQKKTGNTVVDVLLKAYRQNKHKIDLSE